MADQIVATYSDIFAPDYSITGIRSVNDNNTDVLMTGTCPPIPSDPYGRGMLYHGPKYPTDSSQCHRLKPIIKLPPGGSVTSSVFYGPDTHLFNPLKIQEGNVRAVGTYRYTGDPQNADHGVLYEGPLNGYEGTWIPIDMDPKVVGGATVRNTLPHSTMGELIVGNYDLKGAELYRFNAFIYNINTGIFRPLTLEPETGHFTKLVTAYGIWQNDEDSYTIAGGLDDGSGINVGYLVDYNSGTLINLRTFVYPGDSNEDSNLVTHFEGITAFGEGTTQFGPQYYSLAATGDPNTTNRGAAFAVVERLSDGSFGPAEWQRVTAFSGGTPTGNTVLTNNLYGVYYTTGNGLQSYVATFPPADVEAEG